MLRDFIEDNIRIDGRNIGYRIFTGNLYFLRECFSILLENKLIRDTKYMYISY